jgi:hypothetical protein
MNEQESGRFTVGVFKDAEWADRGLAALTRIGLPPESLSVIANNSPETTALVERALGVAGTPMTIAGLGAAIAVGPLVPALQGEGNELASRGLAGAMRRVGFQVHDARIFEALTARGGVLVAVHSEPRAADALAVLHAYGGGNAAIGAWTGRL